MGIPCAGVLDEVAAAVEVQIVVKIRCIGVSEVRHLPLLERRQETRARQRDVKGALLAVVVYEMKCGASHCENRAAGGAADRRGRNYDDSKFTGMSAVEIDAPANEFACAQCS